MQARHRCRADLARGAGLNVMSQQSSSSLPPMEQMGVSQKRGPLSRWVSKGNQEEPGPQFLEKLSNEHS